MTTTQTINLQVTKEELGFIRSALCKVSMTFTFKAFRAKDEAKAMRSFDTSMYDLWMSQKAKVTAIISKIDDDQMEISNDTKWNTLQNILNELNKEQKGITKMLNIIIPKYLASDSSDIDRPFLYNQVTKYQSSLSSINYAIDIVKQEMRSLL